MMISYSEEKPQRGGTPKQKNNPRIIPQNFRITIKYLKNSLKKRGFTLLEFLLALFLSSLLVLLVYQVYSQVLQTYRHTRQNNYIRWFRLTESLAQQLQALYCQKVPYRGEKPFFFFKEGTLAFLTSFGPGGIWLVAYGPDPIQKDKFYYLEVPYTGYRLKDNFEEFLRERENLFYPLPRLNFKLYLLNNGNEEEINEFSSFNGEIFCLEIKTHNLQRRLCFRGCPQ